MGIFYSPLSPLWAILLGAPAALALLHAIRSASKVQLEQPTVFSAWCASIILLALIWRMRVPVMPDLHLHLSGVALFSLMFGRHLALTGISIAIALYTFEYEGSWANLGANILLLAIIPCWFSDLLLKKTQQYLPHHMFVYLFGNGFFGALLVNASVGISTMLLRSLLFPDAKLPADAIAYMLLLAWGEAFLVGFLVTIFAVYRPAWLLTFDDNVYLRGK
ncbi:energy-coupling factor ABC transporter permease [Undibacterium sp. CY7W]|uniref:Energy-coupling factor ABC transporter permease n=1 Tax=Undibacterium rugosum TaxID=2762291 RepID=A0A923KZK3_9BURK|nr:energy-coupling factor ABC transporter permease [Undibacterium rugosum]MBC3936200.1 energy-coupling factor ABC transporter permease [Undibacterium rugosum]